MKYTKIREVKNPHRGTPGSAGIDFFVPTFDKQFYDDFQKKNPEIHYNQNSIELHPHQRVLIPSGIKYFIQPNRMLVAFNKSGVSTKFGLDTLACVGDEDYAGELHISLVNTSNEIIHITEGQKIVQFIELSYINEDVLEITLDEHSNLHENSIRGEKGFGSTGN